MSRRLWWRRRGVVPRDDNRGGQGWGHHCDAGYVTAEVALTIPVIVVVAALILGGIDAAAAQAHACHVARERVRAIAVGQAPPTPSELGIDRAVSISEDIREDVVTSTVAVSHRFPGIPAASCVVSTVSERHFMTDSPLVSNPAGTSVENGH